MVLQGTFRYFQYVALLAICALFASLLPAAAQDAPPPNAPSEGQDTPPEALVTGATQKPPARRVARRPVAPPATTEETQAATSALAKRKAPDEAITIIGSGRQTGYTQFAEDISNVIEGLPGNTMRVIPVLGKGAGQNVLDMLELKGIDLAIVDRDTLEYLKKADPILYGDIDKKVNYITKLFNTEMHIYARGDIKSLEDLRGKKISCLKEGSTIAVMCTNLFRLLKINVEVVYDDADLARQKVKTGEVAAAARGAVPPIPGFEKVRPEDGLHFVAISEETAPNSDFGAVRAAYLPSRLRHEDYPNMIPADQEVPTIAVGSMLVVQAWPKNSPQYQRLQKFVKVFFDNIDEFRKAPRHPKWEDVNLAAEVPGWTRFPAAQEWLDAKRKAMPQNVRGPMAGDVKMKAAFTKFLEDYTKASGAPDSDAEKEALYAQFVQWWATVKNKQP